MPYQTPLTSPPEAARDGARTPSSGEGVRQGVAGLLHDVMTLGELQLKLLGVDLKETTGRAVLPLVLLTVAAVLSLATLPLLLVALAQGLRDGLGWPAALATLASIGVGLLFAGLLALVAYLKIRTAFNPLARSGQEFSRNMASLKAALNKQRQAETPVAAPIRPR